MQTESVTREIALTPCPAAARHGLIGQAIIFTAGVVFLSYLIIVALVMPSYTEPSQILFVTILVLVAACGAATAFVVVRRRWRRLRSADGPRTLKVTLTGSEATFEQRSSVGPPVIVSVNTRPVWFEFHRPASPLAEWTTLRAVDIDGRRTVVVGDLALCDVAAVTGLLESAPLPLHKPRTCPRCGSASQADDAGRCSWCGVKSSVCVPAIRQSTDVAPSGEALAVELAPCRSARARHRFAAAGSALGAAALGWGCLAIVPHIREFLILRADWSLAAWEGVGLALVLTGALALAHRAVREWRTGDASVSTRSIAVVPGSDGRVELAQTTRRRRRVTFAQVEGTWFAIRPDESHAPEFELRAFDIPGRWVTVAGELTWPDLGPVCDLLRRAGLQVVEPSECLKCGYSMKGNVSRRCPECGLAQ